MLKLRGSTPVNFLKKEKFTGSHNDIRFRMEKLDLEGEDDPRLSVTIWSEPYGYNVAPEEEKEQQILSFDAGGITEEVGWLDEQFRGQKAKRKAVSRG